MKTFGSSFIFTPLNEMPTKSKARKIAMSIVYTIILILALSSASLALEYSEIKHPDKKEATLIAESEDVYDTYHTAHSEDYPELIEKLQALLPRQERILGKDSAYVSCTLDCLANIYRRLDKQSLVLQLAKRALPIKMRWLGPDAPDTTIELSRIAHALCTMGKYEEAVSILKNHLSLLKHPSATHSGETMVYYDLGVTYQAWDKHAEAEKWFAQTNLLNKRDSGESHF